MDPKARRDLVEADRVHDQRVSIPSANRVTHPGRVPFFWMRASVEENLTVTWSGEFGYVNQDGRCLDKLEVKREGSRYRALREAVRRRTLVITAPFFLKLLLHI